MPSLKLYWHPSRASLDPVEIENKLLSFFTGSRILPCDPWLEQIRRLKELCVSEVVEVVLDNLRRRWKREGPKILFELPDGDSALIRGYFNRYIISFSSDCALPSSIEKRIIEFLKSFGVGKVQLWLQGNDVKTLFDLPGPEVRPDHEIVACSQDLSIEKERR